MNCININSKAMSKTRQYRGREEGADPVQMTELEMARNEKKISYSED